ncbi:MAG: Peptidase, partial [Bryobacterales bacterium]|nr:Peptidase [Bryobacterales bacterium]
MRFGRCLGTGFLAICTIPAQQARPPVPSAWSPGYETIAESDLRADLQFLSSDALQGRMSLQPGDEGASQWVASEFAKAGLKPAANGSFLQPVPLTEFRNDRSASYVALKRDGAEKQWKFPDAYGSFPRDVDVSGRVVFAGYGITAPELHYDDYQNVDARGKIVLIFDHEPQETDSHSIFNGTGNTRYATTRIKVQNAQAHGAVGVLIVAEPNRKHPSNQERIARIGGSATRANPLPSQALADDVLQTSAATISDAVAGELFSNAGATLTDLQTSIDRDLKPQSREISAQEITIHFRNL